jgi:hypothetical protein
VNAIPCDSRTPSARRWGRALFRDVAIITGPSASRAGTRGLNLDGGKPFGFRTDLIDGTRRATKAGRGSSGARLASQGRVGLRSRHIVIHLATHRLLSAKTSARDDASRPARLLLARYRTMWEFARILQADASRAEFLPGPRLSPRLDASGAKLVSTEGGLMKPAHGESRGKGVLAV